MTQTAGDEATIPVVSRSLVMMLKPIKTRVADDSARPLAPRHERVKLAPARMLFLAAATILAVSIIPLLWALQTRHAERSLDRAIMWPAPRPADALPVVRDAAAADSALGVLQAATQRYPNDAVSYQRLAQLYAARGAWSAAVDALTHAQTLQPNDPLLAWELALVMERQLDDADRAPREMIVADLLSAPVEAPDASVGTTYCEAGRPATCYVAFERFRQPLAADPDGEAVQLDSLFMFPPSAVRLDRVIYASQPVLTFAMGLDPRLRVGKSDGATFEVWVTTSDGKRAGVFSHTVDRGTSLKGWIFGQADLSPWTGQKVTLELRTTGGPAGDTVDDWYAWGDVTLTSAEAASVNRYQLQHQLRQLWKAASLSAEAFVTRGDEQLRAGNAQAADAWYRRALRADPQQTDTVLFRAAVAAAAHDGSAASPEGSFDAPAAGSSTTIPGPELTWLSSSSTAAEADGRRLKVLATPAPQVGAMWWSGAALALVNVTEAGRYRVTVRVQHAAPAPVELALEHNLQPFAQFALNRGDWSWEDISAEIDMRPGINAIGLRFLNDDLPGDGDRNAFVEFLRMERSSGVSSWIIAPWLS